MISKRSRWEARSLRGSKEYPLQSKAQTGVDKVVSRNHFSHRGTLSPETSAALSPGTDAEHMQTQFHEPKVHEVSYSDEETPNTSAGVLRSYQNTMSPNSTPRDL